MEVENKNISYRIYLVALVMFMVAVAIVVKLTNIQWVEGDKYRKLAKDRSVKYFVIPANKGNIYSADGSLLATSVPNYDVRFDAVAPKTADFEKNVKPLADSLAMLLGKKSAGQYNADLRKARADKNRYYLLARGLSYTDYMRLKKFPMFNLGTYKGGLITEQKTVRKHPIGEIARRTIGYERVLSNGEKQGKGIEQAFSKYLNGKDGRVLKQKIAKGQWKPIRDENDAEPQDGYDVISTIDVYIQDIAHHALLKALKDNKADHGCVVVMETRTGKIKAISNLGRHKDSTYYETVNYAVTESHEPGSTYKLAGLMALLEDKKVDTGKVYDTKGGKIYFGRNNNFAVVDSKKGGWGKVSLARGFEVSSNTVIVQAVHESYKDNPQQFVDHLKNFGLGRKLDLPFEGEGAPFIPEPGKKGWSGIALPWMAYGYGVMLTPLQTLTYYNAVANNGVMVQPQFVSEIREWNRVIKKYDTKVINPRICSPETIAQLKVVLENVVKRGTAQSQYSKDFSMAGKTGTAQAGYGKKDQAMHYISSFVGYFPADKPLYSCIVVVHDPDKSTERYYGADVAGPVFKRIAQKIFTDVPATNEVKDLDGRLPVQQDAYQDYYAKAGNKYDYVPNVTGMPGMDAVALLENLGLKVKAVGAGKVKKQSLKPGETLAKGKTITLELS